DVEVFDLLGHGSMGAVYHARQLQLDREVAVKILRPEFCRNPEFVERFKREARAAAGLRHGNVITIHDFSQTKDGLLYILMEWVEGADMRALIEDAQLPLEFALRSALSVCEALQHAHDAGLVHRDLKPSNILVGDDGRVVLSDFGIVTSTNAAASSDPTLTGTDQAIGTYDYMAPEQRLGKPIDRRADVFAFGVVLYQLVTGELPVGAWSSPSKTRDGVSKELDRLIEQLLNKDPEQRPELTQVLAVLEGALQKKIIHPGILMGVAAVISALGAVALFWGKGDQLPDVEIPKLPDLITAPPLMEGESLATAEAAFHDSIRQSGGLVGDGFAFTFDASNIPPPTAELGYRPTCQRTHPIQGLGMLRAAIWIRDHRAWARTEDVGFSRIRELDTKLRPLGLQIVDFPSPRIEETEMAIWAHGLPDWMDIHPFAAAEESPSSDAQIIRMDYRMKRMGTYYLLGQATGDLKGRYLGWREEETTLDTYQTALANAGPDEILADACMSANIGPGANIGMSLWLLWHQIRDNDVESTLTVGDSVEKLVELSRPMAAEGSGWKPITLASMQRMPGQVRMVVWQRRKQ
ncbi:MAG: serine/threonine-protein kinase, partial [Verrucomicrobiota bacterium]